MPSHSDHMDYVWLLEAKGVHKMEQVQSGMQDTAKMLYLHYTELKKAGFSKAKAYDMTLQFHAGWVDSIFARILE